MANQQTDLRCFLTNTGIAAENNAIAFGRKLPIKEMVFGSGLLPDSDDPRNQTALIKEELAVPCAMLLHADNTSKLTFKSDIPVDRGGFHINEVAIRLEDGTLYGYARSTGDYKPTPEQGATESIRYIVDMYTNNVGTLECKVDLSSVYVDYEDLDAVKVEAAEALQAHKDHNDPHQQYLPKIGATITNPLLLKTHSISFPFLDLRNIQKDAIFSFINLAAGVDSLNGVGTVHLAYAAIPESSAPEHSFHIRVRGDKTQMSCSYDRIKAHVPLYDMSGELVANRKQMAQLPLYPEILTDDKKFDMSLSGTTVTVADNQVIRMRGWHDVNTSDLTRTFTVELNLTYHLRFSVEKGLHLWYVGHASYNPDGLPETDKKFDSTYDDALIAKIENGVITPLINTSETFNLTYDGMPNSSDAQLSTNDYLGAFELPLNWSRTPVSDSVEQKGHLAVSSSHAWNDLMVLTVLAMREDAVLCPLSFNKEYKLNRYECRLPVAHAYGANHYNGAQPTPHLQTFEKIVRVYGY